MQKLIDLLVIDESSIPKKITGNEESKSSHEVSVISNNEDNAPTMCDTESDPPVVAYAVPTFQAPIGFVQDLHKYVPRDTDIIASLIKTAAAQAGAKNRFFQIRLASAYLNLTDHMIDILNQCKNTAIHLMTAGFISHGFKPNPKKVGNKGKVWIPAVFDALGRQNLEALQRNVSSDNCEGATQLWYYQRDGWTYHAKGIWLTESNKHESRIILDSTCMCVAATHGSGNYGSRSAYCDLESNLILIFSDTREETAHHFRSMFQDDWNAMCEHVVPVQDEEVQRLSLALRMLLPLIRQFF
jgi:CDP-diacylglycerol--glycerol-3-phosphate 3-phosphatidyltransferase